MERTQDSDQLNYVVCTEVEIILLMPELIRKKFKYIKQFQNGTFKRSGFQRQKKQNFLPNEEKIIACVDTLSNKYEQGRVPAQDLLFSLILWYVEKTIFRS